MSRWKITIEYDGAGFAGWQRQDNVPSIQEEIQKALHQFCQQDIAVTGASRTDAGVHAYGQVAHFDLDYGERDLTGFSLMKALNAHLRPQAISILKAEKMPDDFHARFSAHEKTYTYSIINRKSFLAMERGRSWLVMSDLDVSAMQKGAKHLLGEHDFNSFRAAECQAKSSIRSIDALNITAHDLGGARGLEIVICVQGQAFLHHMVRNIAGTLVMVGQGKLTPEDVRDILEAKDRTKAGVTAPPEGLCLVHIDY